MKFTISWQSIEKDFKTIEDCELAERDFLEGLSILHYAKSLGYPHKHLQNVVREAMHSAINARQRFAEISSA